MSYLTLGCVGGDKNGAQFVAAKVGDEITFESLVELLLAFTYVVGKWSLLVTVFPHAAGHLPGGGPRNGSNLGRMGTIITAVG